MTSEGAGSPESPETRGGHEIWSLLPPDDDATEAPGPRAAPSESPAVPSPRPAAEWVPGPVAAVAAPDLAPLPPPALFPPPAPLPRRAAVPVGSSTGDATSRRTPVGRLVVVGAVVLAVLGGTAAIALAASHGRAKGGSTSNAAAAGPSTGAGESNGAGQAGLLGIAPQDGRRVSPSVGHSRSAAATPSAGPVSGDEFTGTTLDPSVWDLYNSTAPNGSLWKSSQIRLADGELRIVGTGTNATGKGDLSGGLCWCGRDGNRTYGTWQVRAKFDAGSGYHQIIGLWPQSDKGSVDGSVTFAGAPDATKQTLYGQVTWKGGSFGRKLAGDFTAWHTYTIVWRAAFVKMYVDGALFYDSTTGASGLIVPHTPMHLIMQQEVGPAGGVPAPNASTPANVVMHIDWVHTSS